MLNCMIKMIPCLAVNPTCPKWGFASRRFRAAANHPKWQEKPIDLSRVFSHSGKASLVVFFTASRGEGVNLCDENREIQVKSQESSMKRAFARN